MLPHIKEEPVIAVQPWMLKLTQGNSCAATLLCVFDRFHDQIIKQNRQKRPIQRHTINELVKESMMFTRYAVCQALQVLLDIGIIMKIGTSATLDKTTHFLYKPEIVGLFLAGNEMFEADKNLRIAENMLNCSFVQNAGFIYLLGSSDGLFKIGKSRRPANRCRHIATKIAYETTLIHTIQTANMSRLESSLHAAYAEKRVRGEWFALSEQDVVDIKSIKDEENKLE